LVEDIAELRRIAETSGYTTARTAVMAWYEGLTEQEADLLLGCGGIAGRAE
jgi:hypothetical protein